MLTKEKIISGIQKLPDNVTVDEIMDQIILLEKIDTGIEQANQGKVLTEEELDIKTEKWLT